jgi:hypothetical protein
VPQFGASGTDPSLCRVLRILSKDCIKERIDIVGKGGAYIVDGGLWFDEARPENVKTMVEFTKEYGVY